MVERDADSGSVEWILGVKNGFGSEEQWSGLAFNTISVPGDDLNPKAPEAAVNVSVTLVV